MLDDIRAVREAVGGHILKVIIETCLLTEEEKSGCEVVSRSGADYIKTSTVLNRVPGGYSPFAAHVSGT